MSFGSGGFGGFGQQNQNTSFGFGTNNTNNNTTTGFGTSSTFGSNTGTGLFGNTGGSGFGSTTGGFGSTGTGAFGAKPAFGATTSAGGGLFGSTTATAGSSGFGSGGGFGSTTASTSTPFGGGGTLFGGNKPAFGSGTTTGTGLFGSGSNTNNATTGFGTSTSGGFGATSNPGIGTGVGDPPGTASVAFQPYVEKETTNNQQNSFQNILFMDAYKKWSSEELRLVDYNQGRRYGNSTGTGAFGVSSGFGGFGSNSNTTGTTTSTGLFGGSSNNTNTPAATGFGTQNTTTGGFGAANNTGGLFGAKPATTGFFGNTSTTPATTGGLFGNTTGGFGANNTSTGFGNTTNTTGGGGLFGNAAAQNKPATGFGGFGTNTQTATTGFGATGTTGGFGASATTTNTGGGLFGAATNTATQSGGGLFGAASNAGATGATGGFGSNAAGGTQAAQTGGGLFGLAKPATATNTATSGTLGGGLFGAANTTPFGASTNTQSAFQPKPAATTGGGLFGNATAQPAAGGGLFGGIGQTNQAQQQAQQGSSLFGASLGQNQQKPSLFGNATPTAGTSLFGAQPNQQQTGNAFGQSVNANPLQNSGFGGSLFGNSTQGANGLGVSQGLTTSISDAGAYGAPSLFQNLAASEVQNPGPLAMPLSTNKTKTSRRSSILPLYKMNPGSASKFATPQKRGYGFSYSTFGTPNSVSSTASTPASMGQSLLAGSVNRSLTKSISSSNLRRTYNAEDSILLPGAFSASSGTRFYGSTGSSKKLVINRDMRSDLFSTPSKVRDNGSDVSDNLTVGSARKLTKRVSFDTTIAKDTVPEGGQSSNGTAHVGNSNGDLGYLRPQSRSSANGSSAHITTLTGGSSNNAPAVSSEPEMVQVTGKELAIVHEEDASPPGNRCIPVNYTINSKDLGEYWMSPSKQEIESMNRIQRQQVVNFTVGRVNVGQVRFRVPVDLTKINLDSIAGGIVTLIIRSATVYPDVNTKPPVGQGLNVPAEIMLLHTCPRSGPDVSVSKMKKHIQRLKTIPDTTFVSYDEKTAAWTFTVEHFTTYGFDEDEDDTTDAEGLSTTGAQDEPTDVASPLAAGVEDDDDTFNFHRRKRPSLPGAFDSNVDMMDDEDSEAEPSSFLSSRSAEKKSLHAVVPVPSMEYDDMELTQDGLRENELDNEAPHSLQHRSAAGLDDSLTDSSPAAGVAPVVPETPAGVLRARMRAIKESNTPLKVQVADGDNWMDMLQKTVSPQKRDRAALRAQNEMGVAASQANLYESKAAPFDRKAASKASMALRNNTATDNRGFATSIDLMNSLFEKAKAPPVKKASETTITTAKGFMKWPYKRQQKTDEDESRMDPTERSYLESAKPVWSVDGSCIVIENGDGELEPALKRIRVFDSIDSSWKGDPFEGISEHEEAVDVELVNGVPSISTRRLPSIKTFSGFCEHVNRRRAGKASAVAEQQGAYEQSVWELASVLFDPVSDGQLGPADEARIRKENLGRFWAQLVQKATATSLEQAQSLEEKAVAYLCGHKVPEACRALVDSKNLKLATLTSLIGTSNAFKKDMSEQMDDWLRGDVLAEFTVPRRAIYSLLAGQVAVCEGKKAGGVENRVESVVLSEWFRLDWKQAFGLRLWYGIASGEGIEAAVARFVEDVEQGRVPQPRPWYVGQVDVRGASLASDGLGEDMLFGLLKVAGGRARLEDVLEPVRSQVSPFRFRLCWQLNQALVASGSLASTARLSAEKADALTSSFASEVLYMTDNRAVAEDALLHALWVALHMSDPTMRAQMIRDFMGRHAGGLLFSGSGNGDHSDGSSTSGGVGFYNRLVDHLQIPASWVWQAAALYWHYEQTQPSLEAECLLRSSAYADAHRIFINELAPRAIVERSYEELAQMLGKLQPHRHQIAEWPLGGEVYSRFLDLLTLQHGGGAGGSGSGTAAGPSSSAPRTRGRQQQEARAGAEQASSQLMAAVEALVTSLPAMYENAGASRPTEVAAITEMADVVAKETMSLASKGKMDLSKISRLPLTEDRRLRYSTDLAFAYYREVMAAQ